MIIDIIVALSVGLGFVNEYRAEKAAEALPDQIRHQAVVTRDGRTSLVDLIGLVPGDLVNLRLGDVVPADIRLLAVAGLGCDESVLTGESLPVDKNVNPVPAGTALAELTGCALMGTVAVSGSGEGVVVDSGARTEFGKIAAGLSTHHLETEFQVGLRKFSMLLVSYVAGALASTIFVLNILLHKPILDALLFSPAIAVGITPKLLPAVVASSLAAGSRRMQQRKVLVKRLVCIEDLGNVDVLFRDKTGTLTAGMIDFADAIPVGGADADMRWGLIATDVAKDAADVILMHKDLNVLADGVEEGRRIFATTVKYVLMGTSSNFGNMFSAAGALLLLPMLPYQIMLNNLLHDSSQLAIPTDHVDEEQLRQPSHWDIAFIRRFMIIFGPLSSVFDFVLLGVTGLTAPVGPAPVGPAPPSGT